jgi:hypothetical protein
MAAANNACLIPICVIANSCGYQANVRHPAQGSLIQVNGQPRYLDAMTKDGAPNVDLEKQVPPSEAESCAAPKGLLERHHWHGGRRWRQQSYCAVAYHDEDSCCGGSPLA